MPDFTGARPRDFDQWARLARTDPAAFELQRTEVIHAAIRRAPEHVQQRLKCLQWKLDQIRKTTRTPMAACVRMNRLLWDAVLGENGLLHCLHQLDAPHHGAAQLPPTADILQLKARERL